ncbi:cyclin-like protein [Ascodesmis nigricans]|uniref:Cyclin-like protein n=1 Tax=Ascodesmis nigricans TaxID=341454 RepID=A0A4S2N8N8_9PEZI|nr:cyclin-like protein [Ascodesmis nigricans]
MEKLFAEEKKKEETTSTATGKIPTSATAGYKSTSAAKAYDIIIRFCNALGFSQQSVLAAQELASIVSENGNLAGRSPVSSAFACIYMVSHFLRKPKTAKRSATYVAGVSEVTIRNVYKCLYADREALISQRWIDDGKGDMSKLNPK